MTKTLEQTDEESQRMIQAEELVRKRPEEALRQIYGTFNSNRLVATLFIAHYRNSEQYGATARQMYLDLGGSREEFERFMPNYDGIEARQPTLEERTNPIHDPLPEEEEKPVCRQLCRGVVGSGHYVPDPDANGCWANVVAAYEDTR